MKKFTENHVSAINYFMIKKILILFCFFFLANCTTPTSALLGPIFTGAKTGSVYQASLSYSSGKIMNELKQKKNLNEVKPVLFNKSESIKTVKVFDIVEEKPATLIAYKIDKIKISEVFEPEPLP